MSGEDPSQEVDPILHRKRAFRLLEREMGFEPTTSCLEGRNSTAELLPRMPGEGRLVSVPILP